MKEPIKVTDKPKPKLDPEEVAKALGAVPMKPEEVSRFLNKIAPPIETHKDEK